MDDELVRLNHAELELLELAEEYGIWIRGIESGDSWASNNKAHHQYGALQWANALVQLLELKLVTFYQDLEGKDLSHSAPQSREEILLELLRTDVTFDAFDKKIPTRPVWLYRLTEEGGSVWEQFNRPDWSRYIDRGTVQSEGAAEEDCVNEVVAAGKQLIKVFLAHSRDLGQIIDDDTLVWSEIRPWEVRYWKSLPVGYKVEYRLKERKEMEYTDWENMPWACHDLLYGWRRRGCFR